MTAALEGGEWSAARPGRTLPPGKTRYPFYRRLGGPRGRCGRAENLVPTGMRSRTVQPVAQSLYPLSYPAHDKLRYCCYNHQLSTRQRLICCLRSKHCCTNLNTTQLYTVSGQALTMATALQERTVNSFLLSISCTNHERCY